MTKCPIFFVGGIIALWVTDAGERWRYQGYNETSRLDAERTQTPNRSTKSTQT